jgi:hypothetical protein
LTQGEEPGVGGEAVGSALADDDARTEGIQLGEAVE